MVKTQIFSSPKPCSRIYSLFRGLYFFLLVSLIGGCDRGPEIINISGSTFGTTYNITVIADQIAPENLGQLIESKLEGIDHAMSTYRTDSEITAFNHLREDVSLNISSQFSEVIQVSKVVWLASDGAFDPTVGPLVDLWGFGVIDTANNIPDRKDIDRALKNVGFQSVVLQADLANPVLSKMSDVRLDLSAVAKGYAVDVIADLLEMNALPDYLVEIGGETRVKGFNSQGEPWRLAIESPSTESGISTVISLRDGAVATSGDYRNYFEDNGVRYSHTIDPRTGIPITHNLASVTVISKTCAEADAWATALMVLGDTRGMSLANELGLAVYMSVRDGDAFKISYSKAFGVYLSSDSEQKLLVGI